RVSWCVLTSLSGRRGLLVTLAISISVGLAYVAYTAAVLSGNFHRIQLANGVGLPASVIVAIFFLLSVVQNWQLLPFARQIAQGPVPDDAYDDRAPWEKGRRRMEWEG